MKYQEDLWLRTNKPNPVRQERYTKKIRVTASITVELDVSLAFKKV